MVIIICLTLIACWWYQSPYGPGGRYKYGLTQVSWTNGPTGVGTLVLALSRTPAKTVCGGTIVSFSSGLTVAGSDTLTSAAAKTIQALLPKIVGQKIDAVDTGANTISFIGIMPPQGWPCALRRSAKNNNIIINVWNILYE